MIPVRWIKSMAVIDSCVMEQSDGSDGERSERSDGGERSGRAGAETRRFMAELFPALEQELVALVGHVERHDK